jgi:methionyl-tRNA formyltransferase
MRIVFMGTPDFAAAHLQALQDAGHEIRAVYTNPDKPQNRGMKLGFSPVKEVALANGLPVLQPQTLRDGQAVETLRQLNPDLLAVVAYGKILPAELLSVPSCGAVNVHASLLPKYRGSAPIQWAVLNGDAETGVTTMYMAPEVDSGDIIYQKTTAIGEFETSGELFDRLRDIGAALLCKTVADIAAGVAPRTPQDPQKASFTVQLTKDMSPIDFDKTPREIVKRICGLQPWPCATASIGGVTLRVFSAAYSDETTKAAPGTVLSADKRGILIACGSGGTLLLTEIQAPGKKRMRASDCLLGHPFRTETQAWK